MLDRRHLAGAGAKRRIRAPRVVAEGVEDPDQRQHLPGVAPVIPGPRGDVGGNEALGEPVRLGSHEARLQVLRYGADHVSDHRADQVVLRGEVIGDHALADPGTACQLADGSARARYYDEREQTQLLLDVAEHQPGPWYSNDAACSRQFGPGAAVPDQFTLQWADSPGQHVATEVYNERFTPTRPNYLYRIWHRLDFTTILAYRPFASPPVALKNFDWTVDYNLDLRARWPSADGPWEMTSRSQGVTLGPIRDGAPPHAAVADAFALRGPIPERASRLVIRRADPRIAYYPDWNTPHSTNARASISGAARWQRATLRP